MDELIEAFSFERVNKSGAKFDPEKTKWFNQQYLRKRSDAELAILFTSIFEKNLAEIQDTRYKSADYIERVCKLVKEKAHFVNEFWSSGSYFFIAPTTYDADVLKKRLNPQTADFIKQLTEAYKALDTFTTVETEATFKATAEKLTLGAGQVMQLFRVSISGVGGGPALFEIVELLGKLEVVKRLETFSKNVPQ